jgi:hypothetical protein
MISVNIATQAKREPFLRIAIDSLQNQTIPPDVIRVYANDYQPDIDGVEVTTGPDLADNGKFYWPTQDGEIYFTCDDDLMYPNDYIEHTLSRLSAYPECIVSYHGRKLKGVNRSYYAEHKMYACLNTVESDAIIDVPGSGVMAFNARYFDHSRLANLPDKCMVDILVGLEAVRQKVEVVCLAHNQFWIHEIITGDGGIYTAYRNREQRQIELANQIYKKKHF